LRDNTKKEYKIVGDAKERIEKISIPVFWI